MCCALPFDAVGRLAVGIRGRAIIRSGYGPRCVTPDHAPPPRGPVVLRPLGTPARVNRLTTGSHIPAEANLCMGWPKPHRWSPSARPLPEPETLTAGGPR